jgi:D-beta-D-heptose 7-phosphate kinase / D-beta-D-heptose 1-phosphate adenosyltransferase
MPGGTELSSTHDALVFSQSHPMTSTEHDPADLLGLIDSLGTPRLVVVGDLILDHYVFGGVSRISPEAPIPVLHVRHEEDRLGGAANVAANIRSLGGQATIVGAVGNDDPGARLKRLVRESKGLTLSATATPKRPTILKTRMVSQNQQMLRVDREQVSGLQSAELNDIVERTQGALKQAAALVISDYGKGVLTPESTQAVIKSAKQAGIPVIVDPKGNDYSRYKGATAVTPNRSEAEDATGIDCGSLEGVEAAGRKLVKQLGLEAAVITLSAEGVAVIPRKGKMLHVPTHARSVYDVTGAGDTFIAALSTCLAAGADIPHAARVANFAAALKVARFGAVAISRSELRRSIVGGGEGFAHAGKVLRVPELKQELAVHRKQGRRVVFTNGCFDLLHQGHVTYLNFCRTQGDVVVVGLNSDASVKRIKGPDRPLNDQEARARVLAALGDVDYVTVFDEDTPEKLIKAVSPDVLVKGADWQGKKVAGADHVKRNGGKVAFAPLVEGKSTTNLLQKARK